MRLFLRIFFISLPVLAVLLSCAENPALTPTETAEISDEQKTYWYSGEAELSSFKLSQTRYGEPREGTAVMIFVTEDFNTEKFTKTATKDEQTTSVMKLNFTRNFTTGVYPYSIMTSAFVPFAGSEHALKISASVQEWCGHVYMELVRRKKYLLSVFSYFEDESARDEQLPIGILEDELWLRLRTAPDKLPTGIHQVIPGFVFLRLAHEEIRPYTCEIASESSGEFQKLDLYYPELERRVSIFFEPAFPHRIIKWEERYTDGFGDNVVTGERMKTIKSAYWTKNKNLDQPLRKELGLE